MGRVGQDPPQEGQSMSGEENCQGKVPVALGEMKGQEIKSTKREEIWFK